MKEKSCVFCKIISGDYKNSKIYEDRDFLAFMDIQPVNKGHVLVIPKKHSMLISEMDKKSLGKIMVLSNSIGSAIRKTDLRCDGINLFLADGEAAGQEIFHVHLHIIPRFKKDGFGFKFPKNYNKKPSRKELDEIAKKIKTFIK